MTQSEAGAEPSTQTARPHLAQQLGLFDATMMVMGGIVGAGVFMNPYVVAQRLHTPVLILAVWIAGGAIAIVGSFIYAELGARIPKVGGQYVYLREALHPVFGFLYGWALLLIIQTGGMAAVAVTFARYFLELTAPACVRALDRDCDAGVADGDQLPGREGRQPRAEHSDGAEDCARLRAWWPADFSW